VLSPRDQDLPVGQQGCRVPNAGVFRPQSRSSLVAWIVQTPAPLVKAVDPIPPPSRQHLPLGNKVGRVIATPRRSANRSPPLPGGRVIQFGLERAADGTLPATRDQYLAIGQQPSPC